MTHYQDSHLHPCVGHPVKSLSRVRLFATPCSPPGSSIHGILQARVLEWGAIAFSDVWVYMSIYIWWRWHSDLPLPSPSLRTPSEKGTMCLSGPQSSPHIRHPLAGPDASWRAFLPAPHLTSVLFVIYPWKPLKVFSMSSEGQRELQ